MSQPRNPPTAKLFARAFLLSEVCLDDSCFGHSYDVRVGDFHGKLLMPRMAWGPADVRVEGWPTPHPFNGLATSPHEPPIEPGTWGDVFAYDPAARTCAARISSAQLEIELPGHLISITANSGRKCVAGARVADFQQQAHAWLGRVRDWVGVVADQHTGHPKLRQSIDLQNRIWVWPADGGAEWRSNVPNVVRVSQQKTEVMNKTEWQYVLDRASNEDVAPLERTMLAHARNALRQGQCREAVLAAATAVEVTLTNKLGDELANVESGLRERMLKQMMMGKLIGLLHHLGLPPGLNAGLVEARNQAIHRGVPVTLNAAQEAVGLAATVVQQFSVLTHPL